MPSLKASEPSVTQIRSHASASAYLDIPKDLKSLCRCGWFSVLALRFADGSRLSFWEGIQCQPSERQTSDVIAS